MNRADAETRRPESKPEIQWQRHIPAGFGKNERQHGEYTDVADGLAQEVKQYLLTVGSAPDDADLVITISKRPM